VEPMPYFVARRWTILPCSRQFAENWRELFSAIIACWNFIRRCGNRFTGTLISPIKSFTFSALALILHNIGNSHLFYALFLCTPNIPALTASVRTLSVSGNRQCGLYLA
ncbi:MAG: hypothetical protein WAW41_20625, partial [Methylobacter sp.]